MKKYISKWTAAEKHSFVCEMNKYLIIVMFDDSDEKVILEDVLAQVSSYFDQRSRRTHVDGSRSSLPVPRLDARCQS
jgi:uncharacterized membrane-anchored protein